jgi:hypothetical protein
MSAHSNHFASVFNNEHLITPSVTEKELGLLNVIKVLSWRVV